MSNDPSLFFLMHFTEYGIVHTQQCEMYPLSKDDPSERHFISHLDGQLYVNDSLEPYDIDKYCIEFANRGSIEVKKLCL